MLSTTKSLSALTAGDLMTQDVLVLRLQMPLREAVKLFLKNASSLAPVVNDDGQCVGVFSAIHFLRFAEKRDDMTKATAPALPVTCSFQRKHRNGAGKEVTLCTLPSGVCPLQVKHGEVDGKPLIICADPHCVLSDWQIVEVEKLPEDGVGRYMCTEPVTVTADSPLPAVAQLMVETQLHHVIVVDKENHPVGIVSSTDVLGEVAYAENGCEGLTSEVVI